jgi:hypothetical protein
MPSCCDGESSDRGHFDKWKSHISELTTEKNDAQEYLSSKLSVSNHLHIICMPINELISGLESNTVQGAVELNLLCDMKGKNGSDYEEICQQNLIRLSQALAKNTSLEALYIQTIIKLFAEENITEFANAIAQNTFLKTLWLVDLNDSFKYQTETAIQFANALSEALCRNSVLEEVCLDLEKPASLEFILSQSSYNTCHVLNGFISRGVISRQKMRC